MSDVDLDRRIVGALKAPIALDARAREAIMRRVRLAAKIGMPRRRDPSLPPRGGRHSLVGLALAASLGSITALSALAPRGVGAAAGASTGVIGDTVVATLRDTLRLVRLVFDDSGARRVAAVGDFNGWKRDATPLRRDPSSRRWSAVVALRDGTHRYAFVVDDTRWTADPAAETVRSDDGRLLSIVRVARASN